MTLEAHVTLSQQIHPRDSDRSILICSWPDSYQLSTGNLWGKAPLMANKYELVSQCDFSTTCHDFCMGFPDTVFVLIGEVL